MLATRLTAGGALLVALTGVIDCAREVAVGHEDALAAAGGEPAAPAAGGANADENGGMPSGGEPSGDVLWRADHETASFDEWLGDGQGIRYEQRSGQLELTSERAHSGTQAFTATIATDDGELHQAMMGRNIQLRNGRYGAWFLLPESPRADYWVIMKLSNGSGTDRFDIDIEARAGAAAHLRLFEHPDTWVTQPAGVAFPVGRWVHVEALYRSTPNTDGRLQVLQDGMLALDSGARATASDDRVTFYCGSASRAVMPSPFRLFIDDATIQAATLP
jgi:hypothetical protein